MDTIDTSSKLTVEFSLSWRSAAMSHQERFYAEPVNLWRDVLDPAMVEQLMGKTTGASASVSFSADRLPFAFSEKKLVRVRHNQFQPEGQNGKPIVLCEGRFYPQGILRGVDGIFKVSTAPCRYLGQEGEFLIFDLNHPLAGYDFSFAAKVLAVQSQLRERGGRCEDWLEKASSNGPGMQIAPPGKKVRYSAEGGLARRDERPDAHFYQQPRLVHHLDSTCRAVITDQYGKLIKPGSAVLDLMGSWNSHLPEDLVVARLSVLGMNEEELQKNPRADDVVVHDLNENQQLPYGSSSFDAILCTASIEYLLKPDQVLVEVARVLKPGGVLIISFSNRWFPHKVTAFWEDLHEFERLGMVAQLVADTQEFNAINTLTSRGAPRPDDDPHYQFPYSDPVYMVWGTRK